MSSTVVLGRLLLELVEGNVQQPMHLRIRGRSVMIAKKMLTIRHTRPPRWRTVGVPALSP